ncbi:MAG: hypothetical protein AB1483_02740 [Candidatus Zixiibacteriota bacterium]
MSESQIKIGVDFRGDLFYVARVDYSGGRPEVKALFRLEKQHLGQHHLLEGGQLILSVPDSEIILKRLNLNGSAGDIETRARFELVHTLMEDEDRFYFDIIPTGKESAYLGLILRKERLESFLDKLLDQRRSFFAQSGYRTRAAALADGYINFCRLTGGDLICLADFMGQSASMAFVYRNKIIDLTHMSLKRFDLTTTAGVGKMCVELKTLVNFKVAALFNEGISTPLSAMLLSGDTVTEQDSQIMKRYFPVEIITPTVNSGFFNGQADLTDVPLEKYIVALGLAAN